MCARCLTDASAKPLPRNKRRRFSGRAKRLDLAPRQSKCADLRKLFYPIGAFATTVAVANRARMRTYADIRAHHSERPSTVAVHSRKRSFSAGLFLSYVSRRSRRTDPMTGRSAASPGAGDGSRQTREETRCRRVRTRKSRPAARGGRKADKEVDSRRTSGPRPRAVRHSRREPAAR